MRWPFRRNRNQETGQDGSAALASGRVSGPATTPVAPPPSFGAPERGPSDAPGAPAPPPYLTAPPSRRDWVGLAPLRPTVSTIAPLVAPPAAFLSEVSATRSLVHRPAPKLDPGLAAPPGRVSGVATVAPVVPEPPVAPGPPPSSPRLPSPRARRRP